MSIKILSVIPRVESVNLVWQKVPVVSGFTYEMQYSTNNGDTWTTYSSTTNDKGTIKELNSYTPYIFRIRATKSTTILTTSPTNQVYAFSAEPSSPLNVNAVKTNNRSIVVTWKVPSNQGISNIRAYKIEYSSDNGSTWTVIPNISKAIFSYTIDNLTNGQTYICRVYARNTTYWSNPATASPVLLFGVPSPPLNFKGTFGNNSATVYWTPPVDDGGNGIVEYSIQISEFATRLQAEAFSNQISDTNNTRISLTNLRFTNNNTTSTIVPNLTNGRFYILRIRAFNVQGASGASGVVSSYFSNKILIRPKTTPAAPVGSTNAFIDAQRNNDGSIFVSWVPGDNGGVPILDYKIQYYDYDVLFNGGSSAWVTYEDGYNANAFTTVTGLTIGKAYMFRVAAINNVGVGKYSNSSYFITPCETSASPTSVTGVAVSGGISLSWTPPVNNEGCPILHYNIQYSINNGITWIQSPNTFQTYQNVLVSGLLNNTSYKFRVSATNGVGTSEYSASSSSITTGAMIPSQPLNIVVVAIEAGVVVRWSPPSDDGGSPLISYIIQISTNNGSTWSTIETVDDYLTSYTATGLVNGTNYIFKVAATNSIGTGPWSSNSSSVTPLAESPILFDHTELDNFLQVNINLNNIASKSPWKEYILEASQRLSNFIKYNSSVIQGIRALEGSEWKGAYPIGILFFYSEDSTTIAYAGVSSFATVYNLPGVQAVSTNYYMGVNTAYEAEYNHSDWVDIITHELCHALGLGIFWNYNISNVSGSVIPIDFFLSGSAYTRTQSAYNELTGLSRQFVPLEESGGAGTISNHWEDDLRDITGWQTYFGFFNELMTAYQIKNQKAILSKLTLQHLVDLGYEEINPGASEEDNLEINNYTFTGYPVFIEPTRTVDRPFQPRPNPTGASVSLFTCVNHRLRQNDVIFFNKTSADSAIVEGVDYYVHSVMGSDSFLIKATINGPSLLTGKDDTGSLSFRCVRPAYGVSSIMQSHTSDQDTSLNNRRRMVCSHPDLPEPTKIGTININTGETTSS